MWNPWIVHCFVIAKHLSTIGWWLNIFHNRLHFLKYKSHTYCDTSCWVCCPWKSARNSPVNFFLLILAWHTWTICSRWPSNSCNRHFARSHRYGWALRQFRFALRGADSSGLHGQQSNLHAKDSRITKHLLREFEQTKTTRNGSQSALIWDRQDNYPTIQALTWRTAACQIWRWGRSQPQMFRRSGCTPPDPRLRVFFIRGNRYHEHCIIRWTSSANSTAKETQWPQRN